MGDSGDFKDHAELAIAKAEIEADKRGESRREVNANRKRAWSQKSLVLIIFLSLGFGLLLGGIGIMLLVAALWLLAVPVFLYLKRRRLKNIRNEQLRKFKQESG